MQDVTETGHRPSVTLHISLCHFVTIGCIVMEGFYSFNLQVRFLSISFVKEC